MEYPTGMTVDKNPAVDPTDCVQVGCDRVVSDLDNPKQEVRSDKSVAAGNAAAGELDSDLGLESNLASMGSRSSRSEG
jgi:hypothetical protein